MTFGDALGLFRERLDGQQNVKAGAKVHRRKCVEALLNRARDRAPGSLSAALPLTINESIIDDKITN